VHPYQQATLGEQFDVLADRDGRHPQFRRHLGDPYRAVSAHPAQDRLMPVLGVHLIRPLPSSPFTAHPTRPTVFSARLLSKSEELIGCAPKALLMDESACYKPRTVVP
jgi:hypothetical protein